MGRRILSGVCLPMDFNPLNNRWRDLRDLDLVGSKSTLPDDGTMNDERRLREAHGSDISTTLRRIESKEQHCLSFSLMKVYCRRRWFFLVNILESVSLDFLLLSLFLPFYVAFSLCATTCSSNVEESRNARENKRTMIDAASIAVRKDRGKTVEAEENAKGPGRRPRSRGRRHVV